MLSVRWAPFSPHRSIYWLYLIRSIWVDPLDFDQKCDATLPLEKLLKPDDTVRQLLQDFEPSKTRLWALTNAYTTVGHLLPRVVYEGSISSISS